MNTLVILFLIGLVVHQTCGNFREDGWQEPNAWDRHSASISAGGTCPVCPVLDEDAVAVLYYRKLVTNLFNKNALKTNEYTGQLQRAILFTLSPAQLEVIESSNDIRDLDAVINQILSKATTPRGEPVAKDGKGFLWLFGDILKDCFQIVRKALQVSEARFALFVLGVAMLIWFIHRRYNKNLIAVVAIVFFGFGYACTYWECNQKLEAEEFIAYIKETEPPPVGWIRKAFNTIFRISKQDALVSTIREQTKAKLPFCRPDHVLVMYINEMFLNQVQLVIEKCVGMLITFKDSIGFPYNIIAMVAVPVLFIFNTKLIFKYILNPVVWYRALCGGGGGGDHQPRQQQQPQVASNEDRLTGANLKILLDAFVKLHTEKESATSGVQEIIEPLEGRSSPSKSDESTTSDNSNKSEDIKENDVTEKKES